MTRGWAKLVVMGAVACLSACGRSSLPPLPSPSATAPTIGRISTDPFTNATSQHATEVEPSAFAFGTTIVAAFQIGRFFLAGSSDIGFSASHDGGVTWMSGDLPGTTNVATPAGPFDSVTDPAVAYDARHAAWLIASLPVSFSSATTPAVLVSRSIDGLSWSYPVYVAPGQTSSDKNWIVCDNSARSLFYGHCYVQWDEPGTGGTLGTIHMSTSMDGGLTWGPPLNTSNGAAGIAGQPLVKPDGTVIVPIDDFNELNLLSFVSHDGGASWTAALPVAAIADHFEAGNLRAGPLPSAAIDAAGRVYVVWQDCRFRIGCAGQRYRTDNIGGRSELDKRFASADRSDDEHHGSLLARPRGGWVNRGSKRSPRPYILLLCQQRLHAGNVSTVRWFHLIPQRRHDLGCTGYVSRADERDMATADYSGQDGR